MSWEREPMDPDHIAWCRHTYDMLIDGGSWGVPRSGLVFRKDGGSMVLVARMPFMRGMPGSPEDLREYQDYDYAEIKRYFAAAGITVREEIEDES